MLDRTAKPTPTLHRDLQEEQNRDQAGQDDQSAEPNEQKSDSNELKENPKSPPIIIDPKMLFNSDVLEGLFDGSILPSEFLLLGLFANQTWIITDPSSNWAYFYQASRDLADQDFLLPNWIPTDLNPLEHILVQYEGRDLGNGINIYIFASEPQFQNMLDEGIENALERIINVAPFLPTFEPPPGWEPPADTPVPTDFTPPEGVKIVVPPTVTLPEDTELPEYIEPYSPEPEPGASDREPVHVSLHFVGPVEVNVNGPTNLDIVGDAGDSSQVTINGDADLLEIRIDAPGGKTGLCLKSTAGWAKSSLPEISMGRSY